jgi:hypothetical protein
MIEFSEVKTFDYVTGDTPSPYSRITAIPLVLK